MRTTMHDVNILQGIRRNHGMVKGFSYLLILALVVLIGERTIYYTLEKAEVVKPEDPIKRLQQLPPHIARQLGIKKGAYTPKPPSNEAKFSGSLQAFKEKLHRTRDQWKNHKTLEQVTAELVKLREELKTLDQKIMARFTQTQQMITEKNLPQVIQARQDKAVSHYKSKMNELSGFMTKVEQAGTPERRMAGLQALYAFLNKQKFKRSQQPFDPKNLPNRNLRPDPNNVPKTKPSEFHQAGLYSTPLHKVAALGDFTYGNLPGASNPAYLAESDEVVITQAIKDQAAALNYDPVKIYHWVRNNIEWQPAWGAVQNAELTLSAKRGNAMDIASLTIALLRASKIPARYVHGTIDVPVDKYLNWVGGFTDIRAAADYAASAGIPTTLLMSNGNVQKVRMEHLWVEAAIDYHPSRGAVNKDADSWVQMDPSYKQYLYKKGLDVIAISGLDPNQLATDFTNSGTINEAEGWVSGFDPTILQNAQQQAQTALQNYINTNMPNATVGDVIGGRATIIQEYPTLPSSLPNAIVVTGSRYDKLPASLQQQITFALAKDILGELINPQSFPWAKLNNERVTLSFRPATVDDEAALKSLLPSGQITDINQLPSSIPSYLVSVIPELKVNGTVVMSGSPMQLGEELDFITSIDFAGRADLPARTYKIIAGSYMCVNTIAGEISPDKLQSVKSRLNNLINIIQSGDPQQLLTISKENVLGDIFFTSSLGYYVQYNALTQLASIQINAQTYLAAGRGTIGYEPKVSYFFGFPQSLDPGGIVFDIPIISVTGINDGNIDRKKQFITIKGLISSSLESVTAEHIFYGIQNGPVFSASAVKALSFAEISGQKVYKITKSNYASAAPYMHHDQSVIHEIENAVSAGFEVVTHTDPIDISGWHGSGYLIIEPTTGDGAYKINGGRNGSYTSDNSDLIDFFIPSAMADDDIFRDAYKKVDRLQTTQSLLECTIDYGWKKALPAILVFIQLMILVTILAYAAFLAGAAIAAGLGLETIAYQVGLYAFTATEIAGGNIALDKAGQQCKK